MNSFPSPSEPDMWKPYEETDPDEPGGAIYPHYTFTYDPIGNRLTRDATDSSGTIQKEYDANVLNQYESITNPAQVLAYDADGNLTDDGLWTYAWDGAGRLVKGDGQHHACFERRASMAQGLESTNGSGMIYYEQRKRTNSAHITKAKIRPPLSHPA